jgi:hypothetical protein
MCADLANNRPGESIKKLIDELGPTPLDRGGAAQRCPEVFDERALRKGLEGEEKVAHRLAFLGSEWLSIHSIPVNASGTDVDHLLIAPAGVFTLNAKNHGGQSVWVAGDVFMVNGFKQDYVACSRAEGARVSRTLTRECGFDVEAEPVIVVLAENFCVKEDPRGVHVIELELLRFWLKRRPVIYTPSEVTTIFETARDSAVWLKSPEQVGVEAAR